MPEWSVYYSDCVVTSDQCDLYDIPAMDVQAIIVSDPSHGYRIVHATDYYVWDNETFIGVDQFGFFDYLSRPGPRKVLFGRMMPQLEWEELLARVWADHGEKTARYRTERQ